MVTTLTLLLFAILKFKQLIESFSVRDHIDISCMTKTAN